MPEAVCLHPALVLNEEILGKIVYSKQTSWLCNGQLDPHSKQNIPVAKILPMDTSCLLAEKFNKES